MRKLYCDLETYSEVPITHGSHAYAEHAEIMLWAYAIDDGPVACWDLTSGGPMPDDLAQALGDPNTLTVWHNGGMFDLPVIKHALPDVYQKLTLDRVHDTMVQAMAHSLPGSLGQLCEIFSIAENKAKQKDGRALIHLFCKPRGVTSKIHRATKQTHPEEWQRFVEYAKNDIEATRELHKRIPMWNSKGFEKALWELDQNINMRGVCIDTEFVHSAITAVEQERVVLAHKTVELTEGEVSSATRRDALIEHIFQRYGIAMSDMRKATVQNVLDAGVLPEPVLELLSIRLQASTTSTAKYKALRNSVSSDGRLRGTLQFCGASRTGRWSGRLFQPQNLPRPTLKPYNINAGIAAVKAGCADLIVPDIMRLLSSAVRGCLIAPEGKKLVIADLSNIEGRVIAWLAGETWKINAFKDYDAGNGPDLYKLAYAKSFNIAPDDVNDEQRQIGKVQELALGYQGGVGAFATFALAYKIDLEEMAREALKTLPQESIAKARDFLEWVRGKSKAEKKTFDMYGMSDDAYVVCNAFKQGWRDAHIKIVELWSEVESAFYAVTECPNMTVRVGVLALRREAQWLRIRLPSGRYLVYLAPKIEDEKLSYKGIDQFTRKFKTLHTYGGKLVENIVQAIARDIMGANMLTAEKQGYQIVLTVHDELITETPNSPQFSHSDLSEILATNPEWAEGLPLAAKGFEAYRYCKG